MAVAESVKSLLKAKHINVPDEWVSACLEWVLAENPGLNVSNRRLAFEKVYEQWLHADLTELGTCCLPFNLKDQKSTDIRGHFPLQVNSVRDVGQPAYAQLLKVRKADNANANVTAETSHQPAWEPKPSRMLMLQLTDGTSVIQGMEYRYIPILQPNVKPGLKVLVHGTINSRRGVLLLTRDNITVLGGEVESLLVSNALENILARKLGVQESEQPQDYQETNPTQIPPSQASQYYPSQLNRQSQQNRSQPNNVFVNRTVNTNNSRNQNGSVLPVRPGLEQDFNDMGDDDFLDADLEATLSQIENQVSSTAASGTGTGTQACNTNSTQAKSQHSVRSNNDVIDIDMDDDLFSDDFDEDAMLIAERQAMQATKSSKQDIDRNKANASNANSRPSFPNFIKPQGMARQSAIKPSTSTLQSQSMKNKSQPKQSNLKTFFTKPSVSTANKEKISDDSMDFPTEEELMGEFSMETQPYPSSLTYSSTSEPKRSQTSKTSSAPKCNPFQPNKKSITKAVQEEPPFSYLCFLEKDGSATQDLVVKGFIVTLTSRLEQKDGNWNLKVIINDGTASCEVDIENEVLEGLIGMNVEDMKKRKLEAKSNPSLRAELAKMVGGCQHKLISLCSLLHLRVSRGAARPRLTKITPFGNTAQQQMAKRSSLIS